MKASMISVWIVPAASSAVGRGGRPRYRLLVLAGGEEGDQLEQS